MSDRILGQLMREAERAGYRVALSSGPQLDIRLPLLSSRRQAIVRVTYSVLQLFFRGSVPTLWAALCGWLSKHTTPTLTGCQEEFAQGTLAFRFSAPELPRAFEGESFLILAELGLGLVADTQPDAEWRAEAQRTVEGRARELTRLEDESTNPVHFHFSTAFRVPPDEVPAPLEWLPCHACGARPPEGVSIRLRSNGDALCDSCWDRAVHPRCAICGVGTGGGHGVYARPNGSTLCDSCWQAHLDSVPS